MILIMGGISDHLYCPSNDRCNPEQMRGTCKPSLGQGGGQILRKKVPFKVTPKGRGRRSIRAVAPHILISILLAISIILGALWIIMEKGSIRYAIAINIFWAAWPLPFLLYAIYFSLTVKPRPSRAEYVAPQSKAK